MKHVLAVASEIAPLVKTGGLADVVGALPKALAPHGYAVRTLVPGYPGMPTDGEEVWGGMEIAGGPVSVRRTESAGLDLLVLHAPHLFDRPGGPYADEAGRDHPDNAERFAALCLVARDLALRGEPGGGDIGGRPDIVHAHDWQAALAPAHLRRRVGTVMTIHNMAFMGLAPMTKAEALGLDPDDEDLFEFWGRVSTLKAGMVAADRVTTVSPTYARELRRPEHGFGLDGVVRARGADFVGILNGIDTDMWDPATDPHIRTFKGPAGKRRAKAALRRELGLPEGDGPLAVVVSRMTHQKGLDVLLDALPAFTDRGGQVALLGSGEVDLERRWRAAATHPHVSVTIGYDEALSHRMYAGADAVLVPSRFEPCGLTQLYALRYGALPIVARTGGLADTVIDANPMALQAGTATGWQFHPVDADTLAQVLGDVRDAWDRPVVWQMMQRNAMRQPVGWDSSAARYAQLYESVLGERRDGKSPRP